MVSSDFAFALVIWLVGAYLSHCLIFNIIIPKILTPIYDLTTTPGIAAPGRLKLHIREFKSLFAITEAKVLPLIYSAICILLVVLVLS